MAAKVRLVRPGKVMMLRKIDAVTTARKNRMRPREIKELLPVELNIFKTFSCNNDNICDIDAC
jgi:hypothetical protein